MKVSSVPGPLTAPLPAVMVSCGDMENSNILTIAWTGIINSHPPITYISVRKERFSHDIISESGEFVINLATADMVRALDYCGVKSGRDTDKFADMKLTREAGDNVSAPMIAESPVNLECRVMEIKEFPSHDMFIAEITAVHVDEKYVDENGAYDYRAMNLVAYSHGKYYRLDPQELGFFGYSIMKPKTARKRRAAETASGKGGKRNSGRSSGRRSK